MKYYAEVFISGMLTGVVVAGLAAFFIALSIINWGKVCKAVLQ